MEKEEAEEIAERNTWIGERFKGKLSAHAVRSSDQDGGVDETVNKDRCSDPNYDPHVIPFTLPHGPPMLYSLSWPLSLREVATIDFAATLGGDGTVLHYNWLLNSIGSALPPPPLLAFAMGTLGFLTPLYFDDYQTLIERVLRAHDTEAERKERRASFSLATGQTCSTAVGGKPSPTPLPLLRPPPANEADELSTANALANEMGVDRRTVNRGCCGAPPAEELEALTGQHTPPTHHIQSTPTKTSSASPAMTTAAAPTQTPPTTSGDGARNLMINPRLRLFCRVYRRKQHPSGRGGGWDSERENSSASPPPSNSPSPSPSPSASPSPQPSSSPSPDSQSSSSYELVGSYTCLNEALVHRSSSPFLTSIDILLVEQHAPDRQPFYVTTVLGDGLMASTPTGSTAYNMACGGPMVAPNSDCMLITPVAPHSLSFRPIVLNACTELRFAISESSRVAPPVQPIPSPSTPTSRGIRGADADTGSPLPQGFPSRWSALASFDGHMQMPLSPGDYVSITCARYSLPHLNLHYPDLSNQSLWLKSLTHKLMWNLNSQQLRMIEEQIQRAAVTAAANNGSGNNGSAGSCRHQPLQRPPTFKQLEERTRGRSGRATSDDDDQHKEKEEDGEREEDHKARSSKKNRSTSPNPTFASSSSSKSSERQSGGGGSDNDEDDASDPDTCKQQRKEDLRRSACSPITRPSSRL